MRERSLGRGLFKVLILSVWAVATKHDCSGIPVRTWLGRDEREKAIHKISDALGLIREHTPARDDQIRRDFRGILVWPTGGPQGMWHGDVRLCVLDEGYLRRSDAERVAMTIVHEATHAKLDRHGVGYRQSIRPRVEALCFRAAASFARHLPNRRELQAEVARKAHYYETRWSDASMAGSSLRYLENLGAPAWFLALRRRRVTRRWGLAASRDARSALGADAVTENRRAPRGR